MKKLGAELGVYNEKTNEWMKGYSEDNWEALQNKYLDELYGAGESAKKTAAKTAIKGQQNKSVSDQVSTAINEVLVGAGQAISDTTAALL